MNLARYAVNFPLTLIYSKPDIYYHTAMTYKKVAIMAVDYGLKRIGLAVSDKLGISAHGLEVLTRRGKNKDISDITRLIGEYEIETVLIGLPLNMNGTPGTLYDEVKKFGDSLKAASGVPVVFRDERLTTVQAERVLIDAGVSWKKRNKVIDKMAAQLILQNYLDFLR
ncbi:MAG: putative pre-16S rRNA nuclease [bacterium]|nr:MAG: putative pre-16S rRNA nuclease [bacterium]